jgi:hypothetical protein
MGRICDCDFLVSRGGQAPGYRRGASARRGLRCGRRAVTEHGAKQQARGEEML